MDTARSIHELVGSPTNIGLECWDGTSIHPPDEQAVVRVAHPRALARLVRRPGELGIVRAYVSGDLDVIGDLAIVLEHGFETTELATGPSDLARLVAAGGPQLWRYLLHVPPPAIEARMRGRLHSTSRDAEAVTYHYDVGNEFYELVLGPSMTYSCAVFTDRDEPLESAQANKHDLVCRKLGLEPGMRVLDVGCGWGSFLEHAARVYGAVGVGVTLSPSQARYARDRLERAGLGDQVDIRCIDYRALGDETFDAIASVGMFEHVGRAGVDSYTRALYGRLAPGGRLLNHAIARPTVPTGHAPLSSRAATVRRVQVALGSSAPSRIDSDLMKRYVFPDGELHEVGSTVLALQEVGFEIRHAENLREHYALTLRHWVANLERHWDEAVAYVGDERARVWRLYMTACALGFEHHWTEVHQVLAVRPTPLGESRMPLRPDFEVAAASSLTGVS